MIKGIIFLSKYSTSSGRILIWPMLFFVLLLSSLFSEDVVAELYWGIPDSRLPYIARIRTQTADRVMVLYNPDSCEEIGTACGFFIEHARAHAHLNHIILPPEAYPTILEDQADCWVAKNGRSHEVYAVVQLLLDKDRNPDLNITGDPAQRAEKIRACAKQAGNWAKEKQV